MVLAEDSRAGTGSLPAPVVAQRPRVNRRGASRPVTGAVKSWDGGELIELGPRPEQIRHFGAEHPSGWGGQRGR